MEEFDVESRKWVNYINRFRHHLITNNIDKSMYLSKLISTVGSACYELMVSLCKPSQPEEKSFEQLVEIMKNHLEPVQSIVARRHVFRHRYQKDGEDITKYIQELRLLANDCEFGDKYEENLRDQLASGVSSDDVRQRLFSEPNLTYNSAINISQAMETAQKCSTVKFGGHAKKMINVKNSTVLRNRNRSCWRCGRLPQHDPDECPYQQFECNICNEIGHLRKMCPKGINVKSFIRRPRRGKKENKLSRNTNTSVCVKVANEKKS